MTKRKLAPAKPASSTAAEAIQWTGVRTSRNTCAAGAMIFAQGDSIAPVAHHDGHGSARDDPHHPLIA